MSQFVCVCVCVSFVQVCVYMHMGICMQEYMCTCVHACLGKIELEDLNFLSSQLLGRREAKQGTPGGFYLIPAPTSTGAWLFLLPSRPCPPFYVILTLLTELKIDLFF